MMYNIAKTKLFELDLSKKELAALEEKCPGALHQSGDMFFLQLEDSEDFDDDELEPILKKAKEKMAFSVKVLDENLDCDVWDFEFGPNYFEQVG